MGSALSSKTEITSWEAGYQMHVLATGNIDRRMSLDNLFQTVPMNLISLPVAAPTAPTAAVKEVAGNLNGSYVYGISFVTANGETQVGALSAGVSPANQQVDLTAIPTGGASVTARKIHRGASIYSLKYVATINDNTTTTYTDNIADASVTVPSREMNTTAGALYCDTVLIGLADPITTIFGYNAGRVNAGIENVYFGNKAGYSNTSGYQNTYVGESAGYANATGYENTYLGNRAGIKCDVGYYNTIVGCSSMPLATTAAMCVAVGYAAGGSHTTANDCVYLGCYAGMNNVSGSDLTCVGFQSGATKADGTTPLASPVQGVYIGSKCTGTTDGESNAIVIGYNAHGLGSASTVIGTTNTLYTRLYGTVRCMSGVVVGADVTSYIAEFCNTAGGGIAIGTATTPGSYASPLYMALNFLGHANNIKARIRAKDVSANAVSSELLFTVRNTANTLTDLLTLSEDYAAFSANLITTKNIGAAAGTGAVATEYGTNVVHQTVITFTDYSVNINDPTGAAGYGASKVYDFPEGSIVILSAVANLTLTAGAGGISDTFNGDFAVGTVGTADSDFGDAGEATIIASTATPAASGGVSSAKGQSAASLVVDGTGTAADLYLNLLVDDADISAADTIAVGGTLTITWVKAGDY